MTKTAINVQGMSCEHCVKSVENAVKALPGIEKVDVNLKKHTANVKFNENIIALEAIKEAIREAGYDAE
ncbi:MAG: copper chaperone CopZ [Clostridiales bacterium]|nr:copper chaperone CopZ [Clostridiales bacterium]